MVSYIALDFIRFWETLQEYLAGLAGFQKIEVP